MSSRGGSDEADPWLADSSDDEGADGGGTAGDVAGLVGSNRGGGGGTGAWEQQWDDEWGGTVAEGRRLPPPPPPYEETQGSGSQRGGGGGMGRFGFLRKQIAQRLTEVADRVGNTTIGITEGINRSALSAGELLSDSELRSKGADVVITGAQATLQDLKNSFFGLRQGLSRGIQGATSVAASGPKQIQAVMGRVQHRIQQQRLRAMLRAVKDDLVDVQIGPQLYEDAPQELRSRLWGALVQNPGLGMAAFAGAAESGVVERLTPGAIDYLCSHPITPKAADGGSSRGAQHNPFQRPRSSLSSADPGADTAAEAGEQRPRVRVQLIVNMSEEVLVVLSVPEERERARADPDDAAEAYRDLLEGARLNKPSSRSNSRRESADEQGSGKSAAALYLSDWDLVDTWEGLEGDLMSNAPRARRTRSAHIRQILVDGEGQSGDQQQQGDGCGSSMGEDDGVTSPEARRRLGGLLSAMWELQWPISTTIPPDSRYATLLQISIGQEDVDEVITRDIHRTFPEHPQFGLEEEGQAALFNVLKAYALHDLEVGYCQGMAFVAGVLLMYLPEEPAFQALCRLMDEDGPNLRRFYLPGLVGLKVVLAAFENLLNKFHFGIANHLKEHGIPPVLYASQWFLTAFACPFPSTFAARIIDVMLTNNSDIVLMRAAIAVMAECEVEIVGLDDFEDIITHLKVEPCNWGADRMQEVLNVAVHSYLAEEDVEEATRAAMAEMGLLTSNQSPSKQPPTEPLGQQQQPEEPPSSASAAAAAAEEEEEQGADEEGNPPAITPGATLSKQHSSSDRIHDNIVARSLKRSSTGDSAGLGAHLRDPDATDQDLAAQLEGQQSDMNEEYMAMVLALDMMLDPEGADPAEEE